MRIHRRVPAPAPPTPDRRLPPIAAEPLGVRPAPERHPHQDTTVLRRACVPLHPTCSAVPAGRPTLLVHRMASPDPALKLPAKPEMVRLKADPTLSAV